MNELGVITIYKDEGRIRLVLRLDDELWLTKSRIDGIEGNGETITEALEDMYISADLIGE